MSWHWVRCVLGAWGELKRGFEVFALGEMCFEGKGAVEKGFEVLVICELGFQGTRAVRKGV